MRKILMLLVVLILGICTARAQDRTVTGRVTDSSGNPVPFASVKVQGSKAGVIADNTGSFSIKVKSGGVLEVSSAGYSTQTITIGTQNTYTTVLTAGSQSTLAEVIVTGAYNIKRTSRSTSYNAQVVGSEQLNTIRQTNLNNALAGKVAGIQVSGQSSAKLGSTGSVRLRGASGIGTGENVLYVVDGTILPNSSDINMDDIDNVTVLQGPAASAQFGSSEQVGRL